MNFTQETCPDRGLNPGPLRGRRACYHMHHSGVHFVRFLFSESNIYSIKIMEL